MAWENQYFTPDYPGVVRKVVEQEMGGLCLFLQGASGNLTGRQGFSGDRKVYRRLGTLLGLEAAKVAIGIETLARREHLDYVLQSGAPIAVYRDEMAEPEPPLLRVLSRSMKLPLKVFPAPEKAKAERERLLSELDQLRSIGIQSDELRAATSRATQAAMQAEAARLYAGKNHIEWQLLGIRIGSVAMLAMPGEPFIELNEQILRESPFPHTLFSGYSNGGLDYVPDRSAILEGGYEVGMCPFSPEVAEIVVLECIKLLDELNAFAG
jgi:hypothetical protein